MRSTLQHRFGSLFSNLSNLDASRVVTPHVVNNAGVWQGAFCRELSKKWPIELAERSPEYQYQRWVAGQVDVLPFGLGRILSVETPEGVLVLCMVAEKGVKSSENGNPLKYAALVDCLRGSLGCLRTLVGLGEPLREVHTDCSHWGGNLAAVLMEEIWVDNGLSVTLYS